MKASRLTNSSGITLFAKLDLLQQFLRVNADELEIDSPFVGLHNLSRYLGDVGMEHRRRSGTESAEQQDSKATGKPEATAWHRPTLTRISLDMTLAPGSALSDGVNPGTA